MIPELFHIGPLTVYSYGLMLGISFVAASFFLTKEIKRRGLDPNIATEVTLLAMVFGVVGSKLFHLFNYWDAFLANPFHEAFSPGGLVFHGGLILSVVAIFIYARRKKIPFLFIADAASPSLILAYGIGRIGCHLSGDGDYGLPTNLPWGTNYENGIVKPSLLFERSDYLKALYPDGILDSTPLHPTPIYEFLAALVIFGLLWKLRTKNQPIGRLFMMYLILGGASRLLVEFIRLNPPMFLGLTEAQVIAAGMIILGILGFTYLTKNPHAIQYTPPAKTGKEPKKK